MAQQTTSHSSVQSREGVKRRIHLEFSGVWIQTGYMTPNEMAKARSACHARKARELATCRSHAIHLWSQGVSTYYSRNAQEYLWQYSKGRIAE